MSKEEVIYHREELTLFVYDSDEGILSPNDSILLNKSQVYCVDVEFFAAFLSNATLDIYREFFSFNHTNRVVIFAVH